MVMQAIAGVAVLASLVYWIRSLWKPRDIGEPRAADRRQTARWLEMSKEPNPTDHFGTGLFGQGYTRRRGRRDR